MNGCAVRCRVLPISGITEVKSLVCMDCIGGPPTCTSTSTSTSTPRFQGSYAYEVHVVLGLSGIR